MCGQVHVLLTAQGVAGPKPDLIYFMSESNGLDLDAGPLTGPRLPFATHRRCRYAVVLGAAANLSQENPP